MAMHNSRQAYSHSTIPRTFPASIILNVGGGYIIHLAGGATLEPSLYITNLLDDQYLLKGAYFSAAYYGERRNVVLNLAYHI